MEVLGLLIENSQAFAVIGAVGAFIWSVYQFFSTRLRDQRAREFETFHKLVKELVEPPNGGGLYMDRQCAIVYELQFYKRYYPFSYRMLLGLKEKWSKTATGFPRLLEELDLTIAFLKKKIGR